MVVMFLFKTCKGPFLHQCCHVAWALRLLPRSPACPWLPWAMHTPVLRLHSVLSAVFQPLRNQSRPKYIIKYILLIKTMVGAHKGKLLLCVPACRPACVNKEDNRSFGELFRGLSNRYASQRILLTAIFLSVCAQK